MINFFSLSVRLCGTRYPFFNSDLRSHRRPSTDHSLSLSLSLSHTHATGVISCNAEIFRCKKAAAAFAHMKNGQQLLLLNNFVKTISILNRIRDWEKQNVIS